MIKWKLGHAPTDGSILIVASYEEPTHEDEAPAIILKCEKNVWRSGDLCIGDAGDNWDLWMSLPKPPEGFKQNGWTDAEETPPEKDGSWYLLLYEHEGKFYHFIGAWQDNWAASDLGLPGIWSNGLLGNIDREPNYWMRLPEKPKP